MQTELEPRLLRDLGSDDATVRSHASKELKGIGKQAVPALVDILEDRSKPVAAREEAAKVLAELGPDAEDAAPALVRALGSYFGGISYQAKQALPRIGERAVPPLIVAVRSDNKFVRRDAIQILGKIGPKAGEAFSAIVESLESDESDLYLSEAYHALASIAPDRAMPLLIAALKEPGRTRNLAMNAVSVTGTAGKPAVPYLVQILAEADVGVQRSAARTLGAIGPAAAEATPALADALRNDDKWVRLYSAEALEKIGKEAEAAMPALIDVLRGPPWQELAGEDKLVRFHARKTLAAFGKAAVPALITLIGDLESPGRGDAVGVLSEMSPEHALDALPTLIAILKDPTDPIHENVAWMIGAFGAAATPAVPVLIRRLQDPSKPRLWLSYRGALEQIGQPAIPGLLAALKDEAQPIDLKLIVVEVLGTIQPSLDGAVAWALSMLRSDSLSGNQKAKAAGALSLFGEHAKSAIPDLVRLLRNNKEDLLTRACAIYSLALIDKQHEALPHAVPILIAALGSQDENTRMIALMALGELGRVAQEAIPAIKRAIEDEDPTISMFAVEALEKIESVP